MLFEDFQNFDGDLAELLLEISEWVRKHKPTQPVLVPILQDRTYLQFRLYMNDYS